MDLGLSDHVALIVGGSGRIGRATARQLLAEGAVVVLPPGIPSGSQKRPRRSARSRYARSRRATRPPSRASSPRCSRSSAASTCS